ncbi:hypothetical protein Tco_0953455 [Tanacetum coccineum]|uniref:Uncharacterized protein n=1 Tax=Tanacetum coccineum TaxID=301880 RepID=A0ABQ5E026_9ASTR
MMHGPCGLAYPSAPCIQNNTRCKKDFSKEYCNETYIDKSGFVHYKRRDTWVTTSRQNVELDNGYVVPYNKKTDRVVAHISKNSTDVVGTSVGASTSRPQRVNDEIKNYLDARYISPHEACWRILEFQIHYREPAVQILYVHLQNMQRVIFKERDHLYSIVVNAQKKKTITEWLHYNEHNTDGRHLTYLNFPSKFVWYADGKYWRRRRRTNKSSIGRLTYVHPADGDLFYQRMLLCHQPGCTSFPRIRTVNDIVYPTCRAACEALGLLEDNQ